MNDDTIINRESFKNVFLSGEPGEPESTRKSWDKFSVEDDGLWLRLDRDFLDLLYDEEQEEITRHPTDNWLNEPALKFPCTLGELKAFMEWSGYGDLDEADLADLAKFTKDRCMARTDVSKNDDPRLRAQEKAILDCLRDMGYDPKKLPKASNGKAGPSAACRRKLKDSPLFDGSTIFDKAWGRMLHDSIEYA